MSLEEKAKVLVGKTIEEGSRIAVENGWPVRITSSDGRACIVTQDYVPDRINVSVDNGIVTGINGTG